MDLGLLNMMHLVKRSWTGKKTLICKHKNPLLASHQTSWMSESTNCVNGQQFMATLQKLESPSHPAFYVVDRISRCGTNSQGA